MSSNSGREALGGSDKPQRTLESASHSKKRQSGHGAAGGETNPGSPKVRKLGKASAQPCTSTSNQPSSSDISSKKSSELRFLTDFFPEQDQSRPLTRSRTKNPDPKEGRPSSSSAQRPAKTSAARKGRAKRARNNETKSRSPSPEDQQLSNLTVPESEVSAFSVTSTLTTDTNQTFASTVDVRETGNSNDSSFPAEAHSAAAVIMSTAPSRSQPAGEEGSQHVQRASAFLGSLVPRMQHLLGGAIGGPSAGSASSFGQATNSEYVPHLRIVSLLEELRSVNEIRQSEACGEISEMLLLGNEESLPNFPIRDLVLCLMNLLNKDHNFELMLSASRCISNLQEALPRSHTVLVEAIPVLLQKLKRIEYIDVAEQSLVILEVISRRNAKNILAAHGVQAVISHVDFFSLPTQRLAFQIAANCAGFVGPNDFHMVQDCLADLTQRLHVDDKRCVESICTFFNRLVENVRFFPNRLRQIAGKNQELLHVFQTLLSAQPLLVSSNTFMNLIKSLRYMCTVCGDLAVALFYMDFSKTLRYLLLGSDKKNTALSEVVNRPSQHMREIVDLIGELLPLLPNHGIFEINQWMEQYVNPSLFVQSGRSRQSYLGPNWFTKNAAAPEQVEATVSVEDTKAAPESSESKDKSGESRTERDERDSLRTGDQCLLLQFVGNLFPILVEIGSNSTCGTLRYDCMRVMLRMVHAIEGKENLLTFLEDVPLAAYISNTLSSSKNLALIALAVQFADVLLGKLPELYTPLFEAEGVFFELENKSLPPPSPKEVPDKKPVDMPTSSKHAQLEESSKSPVPSSSTGTPAVAALGRLLAAQGHTPSLNQQLGLPLPNIPNFALHMPHYDNLPQSSGTAVLNHSALLRYPTDAAVTSRGATPNPFINVGALQGQTASLYQSIHNVVSSAYSNSVYGLHYAATLANSMEYVASGYTGLQSTTPAPSVASLKSAAAEQLDTFVRTEAAKIGAKRKTTDAAADESDNMSVLSSIAAALGQSDCGLEPLKQLAQVLTDRDLSAFHINHSGIIPALILYLNDSSALLQPERITRLRRFASVFMMLSPDSLRPMGGDSDFAAFNKLVGKIILSIERLEQFNVRVTNLSGNMSAGAAYATGGTASSLAGIGTTSYLRGAQALRFFQSHQIRCNLRRHPSCKHLREWRRGRGSIKVDPFTSISAIERYLIDRGIGTSAQDEESSENDEDAACSAVSFRGRIEILIGENKLPSDMSILQAIRQFSLTQDDEDQETIPPSIWVSGHTLYYRAVVEEGEPSAAEAVPSSSTAAEPSTARRSLSPSRKVARIQRSCVKKGKEKTDKRAKDDKKDKSFFNEGKVPKRVCVLDKYLSGKLAAEVEDPCLNGLVLLRSLYGLNNYWWCLYLDEHVPPNTFAPILSQGCFVSQKLNSKVSRQLADFLSVATQQIPKWTKNIVKAVPFVFSFVARRNFLYCTAFGRDRALMHLVNDANPDDHDSESTSRLVPRLERRKVSINRSSLLKDAQQALSQLGSSRPLLEVGFEGEVGTGFGPTMEFYSALSKEIQKHSNKLWHGTVTQTTVDGTVEEFVEAENGLFPLISRPSSSVRSSDHRSKKFEFIGRLLAQTLLDSRILDIPLATPLFKWLLGEQDTLGLWDLEELEPTIYNSLRQMGKMAEDEFEGIDMFFVYPGLDGFELLKGGKSKAVKFENYRRFIELICHWRLVEGVRADMEAMRKGFQQVTPVEHLGIFEASEMESLFCGSSEKNSEGMWSAATLQQAIRPDHGYTHDSPQILWLVEMLESYDREQRRKFLQFVTGSPRLPVGGFRALHPPLTVVRKTATYGTADLELPSAMTCYNYLKIPPYESMETFRERFDVALQYIYSFHLT